MAPNVAVRRRLPVGAEWTPGRGVHVRVWAPRARWVEAVPEGGTAAALEGEEGGYHSGWMEDARPGSLYRLRPDGQGPYPDPASRFQPAGPHGPSQVVDPGAYAWRDAGWRGLEREGQVLYELHVGTFTAEGTWAAAARRLPELAELGVTAVEPMPAADFPGRFGWGYDGVNLFAPTRLYGTPDDFRHFVDSAHAAGLGVVLDVVYNHLGPDGNYAGKFAPYEGAPTEWGAGMNFDGEGCAGARELVAANAAYWIDEFHVDGLRLDAVHGIRDSSPEHVVAELARKARAAARRPVLLIAESETQRAELARPAEKGGHGLDMVWNDDFHHCATVALTGRAEAYYSDYRGSPQEIVSAVKRGYLYQGQRYEWQDRGRGTPALDLPAWAFVNCLENHDQVGNTLDGRRLWQKADHGRLRALTAVLLLGPGTPMLFQGQESWAPAPFRYFADHPGPLGEAVAKGRAEFLSQFPSVKAAAASLPPPGAPATFQSCKLPPTERGPAWRLHRDLLRLRREDPFRAQDAARLDGAVLGPAAFALRWFGDDRLLLVNLGPDLAPATSEPLLAAPAGRRWAPLWCSEDPAYGGGGARPAVDERGRWALTAHAACLLGPAPHA